MCTSAAREGLTDLKPDSFGGAEELGLSAVASATSGAAPASRRTTLSARMTYVACSYVLVRRFAMNVWRKIVCQGRSGARTGSSVSGGETRRGRKRESVFGEVYRYQPSQPSLETTQ